MAGGPRISRSDATHGGERRRCCRAARGARCRAARAPPHRAQHADRTSEMQHRPRPRRRSRSGERQLLGLPARTSAAGRRACRMARIASSGSTADHPVARPEYGLGQLARPGAEVQHLQRAAAEQPVDCLAWVPGPAALVLRGDRCERAARVASRSPAGMNSLVLHRGMTSSTGSAPARRRAKTVRWRTSASAWWHCRRRP